MKGRDAKTLCCLGKEGPRKGERKPGFLPGGEKGASRGEIFAKEPSPRSGLRKGNEKKSEHDRRLITWL